MDSQRQKVIAATISVMSNTSLVILKLMAGLLMGSVSVTSEALHSGADLLAALVALFSVRASAKPRDKEHPYGHEKIENISGAVEALLIFAAALWIVVQAVKKLRHPSEIDDLGWGVAIMLFSAVANWLVSRMLFRVGRKTDSVALEADAWHLRTDVYTSAGVMGGLAAITAGKYVLPGVNLAWIDPVVAMGVALLITRTAYTLTRVAVKDLIDVSLPDEEENWIREQVASHKPTVRGMHSLRTRKAGPARFVDFHIYVDGEMSVKASHALSHMIANEIRDHFAQATVTIHVEPCARPCPDKCRRECLIKEEDRNGQKP